MLYNPFQTKISRVSTYNIPETSNSIRYSRPISNLQSSKPLNLINSSMDFGSRLSYTNTEKLNDSYSSYRPTSNLLSEIGQINSNPFVSSMPYRYQPANYGEFIETRGLTGWEKKQILQKYRKQTEGNDEELMPQMKQFVKKQIQLKRQGSKRINENKEMERRQYERKEAERKQMERQEAQRKQYAKKQQERRKAEEREREEYIRSIYNFQGQLKKVDEKQKRERIEQILKQTVLQNIKKPEQVKPRPEQQMDKTQKTSKMPTFGSSINRNRGINNDARGSSDKPVSKWNKQDKTANNYDDERQIKRQPSYDSIIGLVNQIKQEEPMFRMTNSKVQQFKFDSRDNSDQNQEFDFQRGQARYIDDRKKQPYQSPNFRSLNPQVPQSIRLGNKMYQLIKLS